MYKERDSNSSFRIESHGKKKVKHQEKESLTKEPISSHHKISYSQTSKKYLINNSNKKSSIESSSYEGKKPSLKHISYDPHFDKCKEYNPQSTDLFAGSKSIKEDCNTCEPDRRHSSKSVKRKCDTYEHSLKQNLETQNETLCESKPKKLKSVSKSDLTSEKTDKHKKHSDKGSKIKPEKVQTLKRKKENNDERVDNYSKEKSSDKSKSVAKESYKNKERSSKKSKLKINSTVEFTSSEANFEDCLGLNDIVVKKKKFSKPVQNETKTGNKMQPKVKTVSHKDSSSRSKPVQNETKTDNKMQPKVKTVKHKDSSSRSFHPAAPKNSSSAQKEKLLSSVLKPEIMKIEDVDTMSTIPHILPNYSSLPKVAFCPKEKKVLSIEDASLFLSSKREKTAVYSGRKSHSYTEVPSLMEFCTKVLIDNIDCIEYLDYMPYHVLKPVLERCNPKQLLQIENYNPYLLEDTNELWKIHCKTNCKLLKLEENETYRELYLRAQDERERKLKSITANISASMSKYNPARQVKLAYVDSVVKPPRDVARKQAKNGTSIPVKADLPSKATPKPVAPVVKPASPKPPVMNPIKTKPKVAPLMAKTLKSMKQCFRR